MTLDVLFLVLLGAAFHASWNAMLKAGRDKLLDSGIMLSTAALMAAPFLLVLPLPDRDSWHFLLGSVAIHQCYFWLVGAAYRRGDLSYSYPLMRGLAPLLVALASGSLLNETPSTLAMWGIGLICSGILVIAFGGFRNSQPALEPGMYALANALVIAAYTLIDGVGVRQSGSVASYVLWLFFLQAIPYCTAILAARGRSFIDHICMHWRQGAIGGVCSIASYGVSLWAMTLAPVAMVAALRETSIVIATIIGGVVLRESFGPSRYIAAAAATGGAILLKLA